MSLMHDQVQPARTLMFTDASVVAGSLEVTQDFDTVGTPAGVRVTYRDPQTFAEAAVALPVGAPDYVSMDLFGCTSATVATEHANLIQAKRTRQRSVLKFDTELEAMMLNPGDRIGVQASTVKWAQGARVEAVLGPNTVRVDRALVFTPGATHAAQFRDETGKPYRVTPVTPGATPFELVLPAGVYVFTGANADQEATALSFGVQDAELTDWTCAKVIPNGNGYSVEAANYDPTIYAGAAAFTRGDPL
jgi:predicted phage tail protein